MKIDIPPFKAGIIIGFTVGIFFMLIMSIFHENEINSIKIEAIKGGHAQFNPLTGIFEWLQLDIVKQ